MGLPKYFGHGAEQLTTQIFLGMGRGNGLPNYFGPGAGAMGLRKIRAAQKTPKRLLLSKVSVSSGVPKRGG